MSDAALHQSDTQARHMAQTFFSAPLVLEAGAGTGKTNTLVARIVSWCMRSGWERAETALKSVSPTPPLPEQIAVRVLSRVVAITFTEAAASEMNHRISEALKAIKVGGDFVGVDEVSLPTDKDARILRAAALLSALDHLLVRTIHAFCRRLLARYPLEAGLHPGFEVDATGVLAEQVVRNVVLEHIQRGLTPPVNTELRQLFSMGHQPKDIFKALQDFLNEGVPSDLLEQDPLSAVHVRSWLLRLTEALSALCGVVGDSLSGDRKCRAGQATVEACQRLEGRLRGGLTAPDEPLSIARTQRWADELISQTMVTRLLNWKRARLTAAEHEHLGGHQAELTSACTQLLGALDHLHRIDPVRLNLARHVLHPMLVDVHERMRSSGVMTFSALLVSAHGLLENREDVRSTIQASMDQLLVDEFQDTDALQCDIVRMLALTGEQRPGLFIVGDPKQSIYGWRNADLRAYDAFVEEVLAAGGQRHVLSVNFRSLPTILDEVAGVVAPIMKEKVGLQPRFEPLVAHRNTDPTAGCVEYWSTCAWDGEVPLTNTAAAAATELEAGRLAAEIRHLHDSKNVSWKSVGLLLRSSGDLDHYLRALRDANIPHVVERDRNYYRRREVIDAAAMVRTILDPLDHMALIGFLRSAVCGVPDAALLPLWSRGFPALMSQLGKPDADALQRIQQVLSDVQAHLEAHRANLPGLERVRDWADSASLAIADVARSRSELLWLPTDVFVERLRGRMMLEVMESARYQGVYRLANLDRFFRRLQVALEADGDMEVVLRTLRRSIMEVSSEEEGRPGEAMEDAVSIMTIHKAKGLDFDHVYVLQMHRTVDSDRYPVNDVSPKGRDGWEYVLMGSPTLGWDGIRDAQKTVAEVERVRLLYVAMTRARDRLVLSGRWREKEDVPSTKDARCLMDLVASRAGGLPSHAQLAEDVVAADSDRVTLDGVEWVFPGRGGVALAPSSAPSKAGRVPSVQSVLQRSEKLREDRASARVMERKERGAPSWYTPESVDSERRVWRIDGLSKTASNAQAVGTAIRAALTTWDLDAPIEQAEQQAREGLVETIRPLVPAAAVTPAVRIAHRLLHRVVDDGWIAQMQSIKDHIQARGLPILLPGDEQEGGPVGFYSGTLDVLYVDADTGEWVLVSIKTDDVNRDALEAHAQKYTSQGLRLTAAVQQALQQSHPPRWEIWFVHHGAVLRLGAPDDDGRLRWKKRTTRCCK